MRDFISSADCIDAIVMRWGEELIVGSTCKLRQLVPLYPRICQFIPHFILFYTYDFERLAHPPPPPHSRELGAFDISIPQANACGPSGVCTPPPASELPAAPAPPLTAALAPPAAAAATAAATATLPLRPDRGSQIHLHFLLVEVPTDILASPSQRHPHPYYLSGR